MENINGWEALVDLDTQLNATRQEWIFRGQSSPKHRLKSTLKRACEDFGMNGAQIWWMEQELINDFKRSCHLYAPPPIPNQDDTLGWLALARHYGVPSRLMDFTYSLFIATYFAAEADKAEPVVWAVNKTWLAQHGSKAIKTLPDGEKLSCAWMKREGWVYDQLLLEREPPVEFVGLLNPYNLNDRLAVQQGLFLCSSNIAVPFHDALLRIEGSADNVKPYLICSAAARTEILVRLYRTNLTRAALFPGLEGYGSSLRSKMPMIRQWGKLQGRWPSP